MPTNLLIPLAAVIVAPIMVWLAHRTKEAKMRAQSELQKELLGKFGSGEELMRFMESDGGRRLLDQLASASQDSRQTMADGFGVGAAFSVFSIILWIIMSVTDHKDLFTPTLVFAGLGLGFLIANAVSYKISKSWGLLKDGPA